MAMWNPWRGCRKCSDGCLHCYIHKGDAKRGVDTGIIANQKTAQGRFRLQAASLRLDACSVSRPSANSGSSPLPSRSSLVTFNYKNIITQISIHVKTPKNGGLLSCRPYAHLPTGISRIYRPTISMILSADWGAYLGDCAMVTKS